MRKSLFLLIISLNLYLARGQETDTIPGRDSLGIAEAKLIMDQQQRHIDSLVKIRIMSELKDAGGDAKLRSELQDRLGKIEKADSLRKIQQYENIQNLKKTSTAYPVSLNADTLFAVYTRIGSFRAKERAQAINGKIRQLYNDPFFRADSLSIAENEGSYDILYKRDLIVMTISPIDALWFELSGQELAERYASKIGSVVAAQQQAHSLVNLLKRLGLVLLIIVLLTIVIRFISFLFGKLKLLLVSRSHAYAERLKFRKLRLLQQAQIEYFISKLLGFLRAIVVILAIYFSLPLLFSLFPETEAWTSTLIGWALSPLKASLQAVVHYLPDLFTVLIIWVLFKYGIQAIRYFFFEVKRGHIHLASFHPEWALPTFNILRFLLYAFMLIIIFPYLPGSGSPAFQGVSVFLGILLSLGSSSAISNIVAGLVITYMRPFQIGDRVKIGDNVGDILEKNMLVTRIRTTKNEDITVPNSAILSGSTINFSSNTKQKHPGLIVHIEVGFGYDLPWQQAHSILLEAAQRTPLLLREPPPFVLQDKLSDFFVSYQLNAYTREASKQAQIYSELNKNILDVCKERGVDLVSPQYHILRKEDDEND